MSGLSRKSIIGGLGACAVWAFAVVPADADYRDHDKECVVELSDGLADQCAGKNPSRHEDGRYLYFTTTRRIAGGGGHYYQTCIDNESDEAMRVHWVIPEQDGSIPSGCAWTEKREKDDKNTFGKGSHQSCIKHGPHLTHRKARIFVHETEEHLLARENYQGNCPTPDSGDTSGTQTNESGLTGKNGNTFQKKGWIQTRSHAFISPLLDIFRGAFFKVTAETQLRRLSENGYKHYVTFDVSRVKARGAEAPPDVPFPELRIVPADKQLNEMVDEYLEERGLKALIIQQDVDRKPEQWFSLQHTLAKSPEFTTLRTIAYRIQGLDESGEWRRLASVTGPLWVSR